MEESEKIYANAFNQLPQIGAKRLAAIQKNFGSFKKAWLSPISKFSAAGLPPSILKKLSQLRKDSDPAGLWRELEAKKIQCLDRTDKYYPTLLSEIYSPPFLLYVRGQLKTLNTLSLAVVGTRKATSYSEEVINRLIPELARAKLTIVSGLALGCDSRAHQAILDSSGITLAVLGGSVAPEEIYPRRNYSLAERITRQGALISEYPPGFSPQKYSFPLRNRIISGISKGTLVIEAAKRSGALITAFLALEQNREVMAVPGNINASMSAGCNMLITKGAHLIRGAKDIFAALNIENKKDTQPIRKIMPENGPAKAIYKILGSEPLTLDKINFLTKFDVNVISSTLSIMELQGLIRPLGDGRYMRL